MRDVLDGQLGNRVVIGGQNGLGIANVQLFLTRLGLARVAEQAADVRVALDVRLAREVQVAAVRLGLARERRLEVLVGLGALQICHVVAPPILDWIDVFDTGPRRTRVQPSSLCCGRSVLWAPFRHALHTTSYSTCKPTTSSPRGSRAGTWGRGYQERSTSKIVPQLLHTAWS